MTISSSAKNLTTNASQTSVLMPRLSDLAAPYDGFIIDLWGVLHDGTHPYPGSIECLRSLREQNKKILLLSNAPRRAFKAVEVLDKIGFHPDHYDHVLTSGEVTFNYLEKTDKHGEAFYYIGPKKDEDILNNSRYKRVMDPKEADFALVTGFDNFGDTFETKRPQAEACLEAGIPLICANPDRKVVKQETGLVMLCAGLIAEWYEEQGGKVIAFGKPHRPTYEASIELLGISDVNKLAAIGDSLHTDIDGANNMGIFSILCSGGILAGDFGITPGELPSQDALERVCKDEGGVIPSAVIPGFVW